jgi:hypothetical protein
MFEGLAQGVGQPERVVLIIFPDKKINAPAFALAIINPAPPVVSMYLVSPLVFSDIPRYEPSDYLFDRSFRQWHAGFLDRDMLVVANGPQIPVVAQIVDHRTAGNILAV